MKAVHVVQFCLAASLVANALQLRAYLAKRDQAVTHQVLERQAVGTALECSQGTEALAGAAKARQAAAAPLVAAAAGQAQQHGRNAQQILATPPASADACTAAQARVDAWSDARGLK